MMAAFQCAFPFYSCSLPLQDVERLQQAAEGLSSSSAWKLVVPDIALAAQGLFASLSISRAEAVLQQLGMPGLSTSPAHQGQGEGQGQGQRQGQGQGQDHRLGQGQRQRQSKSPSPHGSPAPRREGECVAQHTRERTYFYTDTRLCSMRVRLKDTAAA